MKLQSILKQVIILSMLMGGGVLVAQTQDTTAVNNSMGTASTDSPTQMNTPIVPGATEATESATTQMMQDDQSLTALIKTKLTEAGYTGVDTKVSAGVVTLTGTVASADKLKEVVSMVQTVPGVANVDVKGVSIEEKSGMGDIPATTTTPAHNQPASSTNSTISY